ncbi:MAG TPA: DUF5615 family PIN-like protein [Pirellulales bacterium]
MADEDLRHSIVAAVGRREPAVDFATVPELGRSGAPDEDVLELAHSQGRIVVSHDVTSMRSTAQNRIAAGLGMSGLFLAPQFKTTSEIAESLLLIWRASQAEEWHDRIIYLPL